MDDISITEYYRGLVNEFVQEIALMSKLKGNKNIVSYEDYSVNEKSDSIGWDIFIRMELLTDLPSHIRSKSLSEQDIMTMAIDICSALEICHSQRIIHRDIKPDNIFISHSGDYKIGDFGVARTIEKTMDGLSKKGTYTYMAPEVYKGEAYGPSVDLYSLGIVLYKLTNNNREPFLPPHPQLIRYTDKTGALSRRLSGEPIPAPANASANFSAIILKACNYEKRNRYYVASQMKADLINAKNAVTSNISPVLSGNHLISSQTNNTMQSNSANPVQNTFSGNAAFISTHSNTSGKTTSIYNTQNTPRKEKTSNLPRKAARTIGWFGAIIITALMFLIIKNTFFGILSSVIILLMLPLSITKKRSTTIFFSVMMLILSACSFNILNFLSAILFLISNRYLHQ